MQPSVEKEFEKLKKTRRVEKTTVIDQNCFVGPTVLPIEMDNSGKVARDSQNRPKIL